MNDPSSAKLAFRFCRHNCLWRPRLGIPLFGLLALIWFCAFEMPATPLNPQFVNLVNGTADLKHVLVGVPGSSFSVNGHLLKGWVYFEGSRQGETFWFRNCTNSDSAPGLGRMQPGYVEGASLSENWSLGKDGYSARSPKTPGSTDKWASGIYPLVRGTFGMGLLVRAGSFKVNGDNSFEAECEGDGGGAIKGQFIVSATGLPLKCEFKRDRYPRVKYLLEYTYKNSTSMIPLRTVYTVELGNKREMRESSILECEFGRLEVPSGGYTLEWARSNFGNIGT